MDTDPELEIIRKKLLLEMFQKKKSTKKKKIVVEVITSPGCPYCPIALNIAREISKKHPRVEVKEVSVVTQYGREKVMKHNILGTPTILINDKVEFVGVPDPKEFERRLNQYLHTNT